jgi:transcriptional regulator with AAA-type ATPase domain
VEPYIQDLDGKVFHSREFIKKYLYSSEKERLIIYGESGLGKSLILYDIYKIYKDDDEWLPYFINLKEI